MQPQKNLEDIVTILLLTRLLESSKRRFYGTNGENSQNKQKAQQNCN